MVSLITEALSSWDVMAWGRGSIPANSTNSRFSLPRLDRAASRLFSFLSSSIRGLGRLSKKWNRIIYTLFAKVFKLFFIERFFFKCVYDACSLHFNEPIFDFFDIVDLIIMICILCSGNYLSFKPLIVFTLIFKNMRQVMV